MTEDGTETMTVTYRIRCKMWHRPSCCPARWFSGTCHCEEPRSGDEAISPYPWGDCFAHNARNDVGEDDCLRCNV